VAICEITLQYPCLRPAADLKTDYVSMVIFGQQYFRIVLFLHVISKYIFLPFKRPKIASFHEKPA
jgi:hypothetical protein